jgi:hypothetical protein
LLISQLFLRTKGGVLTQHFQKNHHSGLGA